MNHSSFINKSVNYSQTNLLKTKILAPLLSSYNDFLFKQKVNTKFCFNKDIETGMSFDFLIPNNNKKFYLLLIKKKILDSTNNDYNILYFFADDITNEHYKSNNLVKNTINDFYLETENLCNDEYIFEGYLYNKDNKYEYLLTDILLKNGNVINLSYDLRYTILNEFVISITREKLQGLNNHMTINIHPIFSIANENLINIFNNNFIHKQELCGMERVCNTTRQRFFDNSIEFFKKDQVSIKIIEKGEYTDVYNVYDTTTNNKEGILYIKGIKESQKIKVLFEKFSRIRLNCMYNKTFNKWQPIDFEIL